MPEVTYWLIIALTAIVALFWGITAWHKHQRLRRLNSAKDSSHVDSFWQQHTLLISLTALILAGLGQYALGVNQPVFAAFGYCLAVVLFVGALHQFAPATAMPQEFATVAKSKTEHSQSQLAPPRTGPALVETGSVQPRFGEPTSGLTNRPKPNLQASLGVASPLSSGDLITATISGPPHVGNPEIIRVTESEPLAALDKSHIDQTISSIGMIGPATPVPANRGLISSTAVVEIWSGFTQPDSVLLTESGQILVVDAAQQMIYRLDPSGQVIQQWSVPALPEPNGHNLTLSPDGRRLYITDARNGLVYAITLDD